MLVRDKLSPGKIPCAQPRQPGKHGFTAGFTWSFSWSGGFGFGFFFSRKNPRILAKVEGRKGGMGIWAGCEDLGEFGMSNPGNGEGPGGVNSFLVLGTAGKIWEVPTRALGNGFPLRKGTGTSLELSTSRLEQSGIMGGAHG